MAIDVMHDARPYFQHERNVYAGEPGEPCPECLDDAHAPAGWGVYKTISGVTDRNIAECPGDDGETDARRIAAALNSCALIADFVLDGEDDGEGGYHETTIDQAFEELAAVVENARGALRAGDAPVTAARSEEV